MGYILPYKPVEMIDYHNRINFDRWRAVRPIERTPKSRLAHGSGQSAADLIGKGQNIDEQA